MKNSNQKMLGLTAKIIEKVARKSCGVASAWGYCQPKVPDCMKKENKEK